MSCVNEICCGLYILKQNTFNFEKRDWFSVSRNELPTDETLVSSTEIHAFTFTSVHHSQFLISLLLFSVLNFPLDFVVPFDVQVIGLNPPFGVNASLSDQFISHALIFKPRLVVLITPPQTKTYAIKPYLTNAPTLTCLQEFQK